MIFVTSPEARSYTGMRVATGQLKLLSFCLFAGVVISIIDRTDVNWDLQNYHLYGPFVALHGRLGIDYFVAGVQGYLNPLADIPYYVTKFVLFPTHPVIVAGLAGLPYGLLAFIVFNIAPIMLPGAPKEAAMAALLGLTGATVLSEVGTVYDDILIADILLIGLWAILAKPGRPAAAATSGLAVGCAAGLKYTALLFAPGLLVVCLMQVAHPKSAFTSALLYCLALVIGFVALWGWWGMLLWQHFHNPFFPILDSLFPLSSPSPMSIHDVRFLPRNTLQWLFYPFFWLQGRSLVVTEEPLRDPRFALAYLALATGLFAVSMRSAPRPSRRVAGLWTFFTISYFFWLIGFSILRYALPLEAISGIVFWTAIRPILQRPSPLLLGLICVAVFAFTKPIGWGRMGYNKTLIGAPVPPLAPHSLVFMSGGPIAFVIPYLYSQGSIFIALDPLGRGSAEFPVVRGLAGKAAAIRLLTNVPRDEDDSAVINAKLAPFGLVYSESTCLPVHSPVQKIIRLCDVNWHAP